MAGCNELSNEEPAANGDGGGGGRQATLAVQPDQEAIQQESARISQEVQNGSLDQAEAQQEMQAVQQEAIGEAVTALESTLADTEVSIEDSSQTDQGVLLVAGPAGGLIDLLSEEAVGGLLAASAFEQMGQQAGASAAGN